MNTNRTTRLPGCRRGHRPTLRRGFTLLESLMAAGILMIMVVKDELLNE